MSVRCLPAPPDLGNWVDWGPVTFHWAQWKHRYVRMVADHTYGDRRFTAPATRIDISPQVLRMMMKREASTPDKETPDD